MPDRPEVGTVANIEARANERWLMDEVISIVESGRDYSVANNRSNYLPNLLATEPNRPKRFGQASIKATFERLANADTIKVRAVRDAENRRTCKRVIAVGEHNFQETFL